MGSWQMTAQHFLFAQCVLSIYLSHPWKQSTPAGAQVKVTETVVEKRALLTISVLPQKLLSEILDASYGSGQNGEIGKHYLLAEGAAQFPFQPAVIPLPWLNTCTGKGLLIDFEMCLWSLHFHFYSFYICKRQGRKAKIKLTVQSVFSINCAR